MDRNRHSRQSYNQINHRGALGESRHHRDSTFFEVESNEHDRTTSISNNRTSQTGYTRAPKVRRAATNTASAQDSSYQDHAQRSPFPSQRIITPLDSNQYEQTQIPLRNGRSSISPAQLDYGIAPSFTFNISTGYHGVQPASSDTLTNQFEGQLYYGANSYQTSNPLGIPPTSSQNQAIPQLGLDEYRREDDISEFDSGVLNQVPEFPLLSQQLDLNQQQPLPSVDNRERYAIYEQLLRRTNTSTLAGRLQEARVTLLELASWLTENVEPLGLTQDGPVNDDWRQEYKRRLSFWEDINNCWLAFLQRQYSDSRSKARSRNHDILSKEMLVELGEEVIRVADRLEEFALVDYQMGFHERELVPRSASRQWIRARTNEGTVERSEVCMYQRTQGFDGSNSTTRMRA